MSDIAAYTPNVNEEVEFDKIYHDSVIEESKVPVRRVNGKEVIWAPQPGAQETFMSCPLMEALMHGNRGGGKTDTLLMSYAQHVGKGFGDAWRGVIFRQTYPQLADIQAKSEKWFRQIFPSAQFNRAKMTWSFPGGEMLMFRHMAKPADYWNYHGFELPFIGWEELTNWMDSQCYLSMIACCRTSKPGVPRMIRATTNPYGVGHNWIKRRFNLAHNWWKTVIIRNPHDDAGNIEPDRCSIHSHVRENKILLSADPNYDKTITASAANPAMLEAWRHGSWDIVAGGMFDDVWSDRHNIVGRFDIPINWRIDRSFDWGSSKPFSVGWWCESDGSDLRMHDGTTRSTVRGDLFRIKEWYGWTGQDNQGLRMLAADIAKGIVEREVLWNLREHVQPGPADSSIYDVENGRSIAMDMEKPIRMADGVMHRGVIWTRADKSPGSRKAGWEMMRKMFKRAWPNETGPREEPGLFIVGTECEQFLRTVISLPRDEKDMDDVDTDAEDHIGDEARYKVKSVGSVASIGKTKGMH